ncbi:MAG: amphi-Trp domain-containing protein [Gammaproteobacteria bacterium]
MSDKIDKKKIEAEARAKEKVKHKEKKQAKKIARAEKIARKKASSKAKEVEKKAKKAAEKAREMAKKASKKRDKQETKIKYDRRMKREEAVTYFTSLINGLEKGSVQFKQGKDTVVITPSELVDVEIRAETKGKMEKVTFEIRWLTTSAQDLSISSGK